MPGIESGVPGEVERHRSTAGLSKRDSEATWNGSATCDRKNDILTVIINSQCISTLIKQSTANLRVGALLYH